MPRLECSHATAGMQISCIIAEDHPIKHPRTINSQSKNAKLSSSNHAQGQARINSLGENCFFHRFLTQNSKHHETSRNDEKVVVSLSHCQQFSAATASALSAVPRALAPSLRTPGRTMPPSLCRAKMGVLAWDKAAAEEVLRNPGKNHERTAAFENPLVN